MTILLEARPTLSTGASVKIHVERRTSFSPGTEKLALIEGKGNQGPISLIERPYNERYLTNWHIFRDAGLPVVPTVLLTSGNNLLVPDIKSDNSEIYGKALLENFVYSFRANPERDEDFNRITADISPIHQQVLQYVDLANRNGIILPEDDPFELVIHPDERWELMILDLDRGDSYNPTGLGPTEIEAKHQQNIKSGVFFMDILSQLRERTTKEIRW